VGALSGGIVAEWIGIPKTLLGCAIVVAIFGVPLLPRIWKEKTPDSGDESVGLI